MGAPIGLEISTVLKVAEIEGADTKAIATLVPAYEAGMVAGMRKKMTDGRDEAVSDPPVPEGR